MKYYSVEPEVAGGWGKNTDFERTPGKGTVVHKLHYQFDGWLGDELLTSTPCFIVTERLAERIRACGLTGVTFDQVEISRSVLFDDLYPNRVLPPFVWMKVDGAKGVTDFFIGEDARLVVSERAWEVLKAVAPNAILSEFTQD